MARHEKFGANKIANSNKLRSLTAALMSCSSPAVLGMMVAMFTPQATYSQAVNLGPQVNNIRADGRTKTRIVVKGKHTVITTKTVSNGTGFNSFSDFQQAAGTRVDLIIPNNAGSLVNIVRNGSVVINGTLNAYKNGKIGGNVFFADSHGFIVGKSGTINVGSLTVSTPTAKFLDNLIGANGRVNSAVANQLMRGEIPLSKNGVISISGKINADGGITLHGQTVHVSGRTGPATATAFGQKAKFKSTVNATGMVEGAALVSRGGRISIVSAGSTRISGSLNVSRRKSKGTAAKTTQASNAGGAGGTISIKSGGNIIIDPSAVLSADGAGANGAGGEIIIKAGDTLIAADHSRYSATGTGAGVGGFIELSGKTAMVGGVHVDLSSEIGISGTFLLDPFDLIIGGNTSQSGADDNFSLSTNIISAGANIVLQADNSITIAAGGILDSRRVNAGGVSTGDSGNITLQAPSITLGDGSQILAGVSVGSAFEGGDVLLEAIRTQGNFLGKASTEIVLGQGTGAAPILTGRNITLMASATVNNGILVLALPNAKAEITINSASISASGLLKISATANASGSPTPLPLGISVTNVLASIDIKGSSVITAGSMTLTSSATALSRVVTKSLAPASSAADGAVAVSKVTSIASSRIGGNASVTVDNALDIEASNTVVSVADATPHTAAFGASVGVSVVRTTTLTEIADAATIISNSLKLESTSSTSVSITAAAAAGGATEPDAGSQANDYLSNPTYSNAASTSSGKVSVVGALAISDLVSTTSANLTSSIAANITNAISATSGSENQVTINADGSAVNSGIGVGVAVAINLAKVSNDVLVSQNINAAKITLLSRSIGLGNDFKTSAKSGAGASKVGVAGSLGVNLIDTQSSTLIATGTTITMTGGGAVNLSSNNQTDVTLEALPTGGGATGNKVGVGASVAINIIANRSTSEIADNATITGGGDLTLAAAAIHSAKTEASAGSAGGISVTPALGLSLINNTTTARLGTGTTQTNTGNVSVTAAQISATITIASGKTAGSKIAVGAALALALVDDTTLAITDRDINATGTITFGAAGASSSTLNATAGTVGAAETDENGNAPAGGSPSVDDSVTTELGSASSMQRTAGVGNATQQGNVSNRVANGNSRSANTSEGKVSVAAAAAINVQDSIVTAGVPDGVTITSGGALKITASNNTEGLVTSTGASVGLPDSNGNTPPASKIGVGVAVSVNAIKSKNSANLGVAPIGHSVGALTVAANKLDVAKWMANPASTDTKRDTYLTKATSGAGASKVGIAGSVALNLINSEATATVDGPVTLTGGGTVNLEADQEMLATSIAAPFDQGATGGKVGVGASFALNNITTNTTAEVKDGANLINGSSLSVDAASAISTVTEASAGSAGGIAVDASLALALLDERTNARVGTGTGLAMGTGAVSITAANTGTNTAKSTGENKSGKIGVGASAALIFGTGAQDGVLSETSATSASLARNITAGSLTISATSVRTYDAAASATASGGKFSNTDSTRNDTTGGSVQSSSALNRTSNSQSNTTRGTNSSSKITVAAAAGIAGVQDNVSATLGSVAVNVANLVLVNVSNKSGVSVSGSGKAVKASSKVGVGIGVGLAILRNTSTASIADGAHIIHSGGLTVSSSTEENVDSGYLTKLTAYAEAGASSKKISVAGAMAIAISTGKTRAMIGDNVVIDDGGAVSVSSDNKSQLAAKAFASSTSTGNTAVGAGVALVVSNKENTASIGSGNVITAGSVAVRATNHIVKKANSFVFSNLATLKTDITQGKLLGANNYYVEAIGGGTASATSVQGSFGVMVLDDQVTASIGKSQSDGNTTSTTINASGGDVTVEAANDFLAKALTGAISLSRKTGVGVSSNVIVSSSKTTSLIADNAVITNAGNFANRAMSGQDIQTFSITAAGGSTTGVAGVVTVLTSTNETKALLGIDAHVTASGAVGVEAKSDFKSLNLAGGAAGGGTTGVGAAGTLIVINNVTRAALANGTSAANAASIDAGGAITITAEATEKGDTFIAAGAAAGTTAVGAGAAVYVMNTVTEALVGDFALIGQTVKPSSLTISASDATTLNTIAGAVGIGGTTGVGGSASVGVLSKTLRAEIGNSANIKSSDVSVSADSSEDIQTLVVGLGVAGTTGAAGAFSVYSLNNNTTAIIDEDAVVLSDGNVGVMADDTVEMNFLSGALGGSGSSAVGAAASVTVVNNTTKARIADRANVTALGLGSAMSYVADYTPTLSAYISKSDLTISGASTGTQIANLIGADRVVQTAGDASYTGLRMFVMERKSTPVMKSARGVIVNATGKTELRSLVVGAAVSGSGSIGLSGNVPVISSTVEASIGNNARINIDNNGAAGANQSVVVTAAQDIFNIGISGSVAVGGSAGIGAGIDVAVITPVTRAIIGNNTQVNSKRDTLVTAYAHEDFVGAGASVGVGGTAGVAGGVSVFALNAITEAKFGDGSTVNAGGNVAVKANDITRTAMVVGGIGGGGTAGIGASIGLTLLTKTTTASIGTSTTVNALGNSSDETVLTGDDFNGIQLARGVVVSADSNESIFTLGIAGGVGGTAGIAGNVTVETLDITTLASIGENARINTTNAGANANQDVTVTARDSSAISVFDGAIAIGAYAGIAGAVDVGILRNTTAAFIGDGADVNAARNVTLAGLQNIATDTTVISAAGSLVGIAAGVAVYSIGDGLDPNSEAADNLEDSSGNTVGDFVQGSLSDRSINDQVLQTAAETRVKDISAAAQAKRSALDIKASMSAANATPLNIPAGTSASIGSANITAGGRVALQSRQKVDTNFIAGALGAGGVGLGAGVGVVIVDTKNTAQIKGDNADLIRSASLLVKADTNHVFDGKALVAALGGVAGAAAIDVFTDKSVTQAIITGSKALVTGVVNVGAYSKTKLNAIAGAVGGGGSAAVAGAIIGVINKTTTAEIDGDANITSGDVVVDADSIEEISTITAGLAAGGAAGGAGTVSVFSITTATTAKLGSSTTIQAAGNVAVLADDTTSVDNLNVTGGIGGAAGIGAAIGVVVINDTTLAKIDNGANVTALGNTGLQQYVVSYDDSFAAYTDNFKVEAIDPAKVTAAVGNADSLLTAEDAKTAGMKLLTQKRQAVAVTALGKGVIVNATGKNALRNLTIGGGAGGFFGAALSASVPIVTANTTAEIGTGALINQGAGVASTEQSVRVAAASDFYALGVSGAVSVGGVAGVGAGISVAVIENNTRAITGAGSIISANGDVLVSAKASEDFAAAAVAGSIGGLASLAGGVSTLSMKNITQATLGGTVIAQGNVDVIAEDITRTGMIAGSVAVSLGGGIGASVGVVSLNKTTTASIADGAMVTAFGNRGDHTIYTGGSFAATRAAGGINVLANSAQSIFTLAVAGAAGLGVGVSGVVSLELVNTNTSAFIGNNVGINTDGGNAAGAADQDVAVTARDTTVTSVFDGGFAAGLGAGIAGSVDVGVFKNSTAAYIGNDSTINAKRDVLVAGLSNKAGKSTVVSGAGGIVGIAAGVSIYNYGNGVAFGGEADIQLKGASQNGFTGLSNITGDAQGQLSNNEVNRQLQASNKSDIRNISAVVQAKRASVNLTAAVSALAVPAGTSASIGSTTINSGGAVNVNSSDALVADIKTGAIAVGVVGLGAGVGVLEVNSDATSQISGTSTIIAGSAAVNALTRHTLTNNALIGTGGLVAGSAGVALITDRSNTHAFINGQTVIALGGVAVNADTQRVAITSVDSVGVGLAFAAGVSVARSEILGSAKAEIKNNANVGTAINRSGNVTVSAKSNDSAVTSAKASGGGIGGSAQGANANSIVRPTVTASVVGAQIYSTGEIDVTAQALTHADASARGIAVAGGLAVAGSAARADVNADVDAYIAGSTLDAAAIDINAISTTSLAKAFASGASGAFVGISATNSWAGNYSSANATLTGSRLVASGAATVDASNISYQAADASGIAAGIIAAGSNDATAISSTVTTATLTNMQSINTGSLGVNAYSADTNNAGVMSGSGGVIAGAAGVARTFSISTTNAALATTTPAAKYQITVANGVGIGATHTSSFGGYVDTRQASLVGSSGAELYHDVINNVYAGIGDDALLRAGDLAISAQNHSINAARAGNAWNVESISGGLGNFPSGGSTVNITHVTNATIGARADIHLLAKTSGFSTLSMEAFNNIHVRQKVKLDSSGGIASAKAEIAVNISSVAVAAIGDDSQVIVDVGDIAIATWGQTNVDIAAVGTTYGAAGILSGKANITSNSANNVTIGSNVRLEATSGQVLFDGSNPTHAEIDITAGRSLTGIDSSYIFKATLDLFNNTLIAITTTPDPTITVNSTGHVLINPSATLYSGIRAAGDITIGASRGGVSATAVGTGKDIFLEYLASLLSAISNAFGGGSISFDTHGGTTHANGGVAKVTNNGTIQTGLQRHKTLTLAYDPTCTPSGAGACIAIDLDANIGYDLSEAQSVGWTVLDRLSELNILIRDYAADPIAKAAYQSEISFLQKKLVSMGLGTFVAGVYQAGPYAGPTAKDAALANVAANQADIVSVNTEFYQAFSTVFGTATQVVVGGVVIQSTATTSLSILQTYIDPYQGVEALVTAARVKFGGIVNYNVTDPGDQKTNHDAMIGAVANGKAAANAARAVSQTNIQKQADINTAVNQIRVAETALEVALFVGNAGDITTASTTIAAKKVEIANLLGQIVSNNSYIATQTEAAKNWAIVARDRLSYLNNAIVASGDDANVVKENDIKNGVMSSEYNAITNDFNIIAVHQGLQNTAIAATGAKIGVLNSLTTTAGTIGGVNSLTQYVGLLNGLSTSLSTNRVEAAKPSVPTTGPTVFTVKVKDTLARLGNININASQLVGGGKLHAPGDAKILITNETSNTLEVGNMLIPDYDSGHVRFNEVLVDDNADINVINPEGAVASFSSIETTLTTSRGLVDIVSNYNGEDSNYFSPGSPIPHKSVQRVAPDIVLKTGAVINNTNGKVKITSSSGNIYIRGKINAGSVEILAKNGDFVASYVNGVNHIGGDPGGFGGPVNPAAATQFSQAGNGITANGAISIAARYININSTIQSGIANWNLNLDGNEILTSTAAAIGLDQAAVDAGVATYLAGPMVYSFFSLVNTAGQAIWINMAPAGFDAAALVALQQAITQYKLAIVVNPNTNPIVGVLVDGVEKQINIKDYLSGRIEGRVEFTRATADAYLLAKGGEGIFNLIDIDSNIGAAYDAKNQQYLVNGASVHGGYIQLFGQIINTSAGVNGQHGAGHLNVLDGFGTININNATGLAVVLKTLNTGDDAGEDARDNTSTGTAGKLRGTAGIIDITDVISVNTSSPSNIVVNVKNTIYSRDYVPGAATGDVKVETRYGTIDNATGNINYGVATKVSAGSDRTATYNPTVNQRYAWATGTTYTTSGTYKSEVHVNSAGVTVEVIGTYTPVTLPVVIGQHRLADGTYVTTQRTQVETPYIVNGLVVVGPQTTVTNATLTNTPYVNSTYSFIKEEDTVYIFIKETRHGSTDPWYLPGNNGSDYGIETDFYAQQYFVTVKNNSIKADYPISINFIGSNTGGINIQSQGDVVLTNNLTNVAGTTTINVTGANKSIIQGSRFALLKTRAANLAAGGSIGGVKYLADPASPSAANAAIALKLTGLDQEASSPGSRWFSALARNGNVVAISRGDLIVDQVTAVGNGALRQGNVNLVSYAGIQGKNTNALVQGNRVSLTAIAGAIGSTADGQQLNVQTGFTTDQTYRPFGEDPTQNAYYGLSATASNDIGIRSTSWTGNADGTMLVDKVLSLGGDVRLTSTGHILDNNPVQQIDTRTYDQLLGYWQELGLMADGVSKSVNGDVAIDGTNNANKQANAISAFENSKTQSYNQYWAIRETQADNGTTYDATYNYTLTVGSAQHTALSKYYTDKAVADGVTGAAAITAAVDAALLDYQTRQSAEYKLLHAKVGALTTNFDMNYKYASSAEEKASLVRGAVWTERQLAFSLAPGALKTVTSTNPVLKDSNVSGRTVTIEAATGIGETVGAGTANVGISISSDTHARDMTLDQRVALAAAERSDLLLTVVTLSGDTVEIPLGTQYEDLTAPQRAAFDAAVAGDIQSGKSVLKILNKRPLNFNATQALNINVTASPTGVLDSGTAYLASQGSALLGRIETSGETRIKVRGSISNAAGGAAISTGNLILEASLGGVGSLTNVLLLNQKVGTTTTARAQNGVNLEFENGGNIDTIYSPESVKLKALNGSLLNANNDELINILSTQVDLTAVGGTIGTVGNYLNVGVNLGGGISALSDSGINLNGPLGNQFIIKSAKVTGAGTINLRAAGDSIIDGLVETAGTINLAPGGRQTLTENADVHSAAGSININANSVKMVDLSVTRADSGKVTIVTVEDAQVTGIISGSAATDAVSITSGGRVFAGTLDPRVDIFATAAGAGVKIKAASGIGDTTQPNLSAGSDVAGAINTPNALRINTGKLDIESDNASINIRALSDVTMSTFTANNGSIDVVADKALTITQANSGGTQNFTAKDDVIITQLTTTGIPGDAGDVNVTSTDGAINVGTINANGSSNLNGNGVAFGTINVAVNSVITSSMDITGTSQTAGGAITDNAGKAINLDTATSGGTQNFTAKDDVTITQLTTTGIPGDAGDVNVTSTDGAINVGTINANGSSTLKGNGVTFGLIEAKVDSTIVSTLDITGESQIAGGTVDDTAGSGGARGSIDIKSVQATNMKFSATGSLTFPSLKVAKELSLGADIVTAGITQVPSGPDPLQLALTGANGGVGTRSDVTVDAPAGIILKRLSVVDSTLETTARKVDVQSAFVPGSFRLQTPLQVIFVNNRSRQPQPGSNVQMYEPSFSFRFDVDDFTTSTTSYVVQYDATANVTDVLSRLGFKGISLIRDSVRNLRDADDILPLGRNIFHREGVDNDGLPDLDNIILMIDGVSYKIITTGFGPAVQLNSN